MQYHRHHKNDRSTRTQDLYNVPIQMKLKIDIRSFRLNGTYLKNQLHLTLPSLNVSNTV